MSIWWFSYGCVCVRRKILFDGIQHYNIAFEYNYQCKLLINIKRYFKLNNNLTTPTHGMPGYNPCARYDVIYKCLVVNMNYLTKKADEDGTMDETTWGFSGFGTEATYRMQGKKKDKGGQTTLLSTLIVVILVGTSTATNYNQNQRASMHRGQRKYMKW